MFARELENRQRKFEREAKDRILLERRRLEKIRKEKETARKLEERMQEEHRLKRIADEAAREAEEERQQAVRESNRGVFWEKRYVAVPIPDSMGAEKGIKRVSDKILLPSSVSNDLMDQGSSRNGAMLFEVATPSGRSTHAGLLEFTAAEGTVGLPRKVIRSLWGPEGECSGTVTVSYKRLEDGKYARFQPVRYGFHEAIGDEMRSVLEGALMTHCTLTEGDYLELHHNGVLHELKVVELEPRSAVSVMDTDLEVDVTPSEEVEAAIKAEEEAARARELERARLEEEARQLEAEQRRLDAEEARRSAEEAAERQRFAEMKARSLPAEVDENSPQPKMLCLVRMPQGSRHQRRFRLEEPLSHIFDFVDAQGGGGYSSGCYRLVTQFPRRVFLPSGTGSIHDAGLTQSQEVLLVEPIQEES
ncbi:hypothetical protein BSKO_03641 [Bryopsis sp. KO-2023]|nr:hypothetical protein BSKO_03641 [Bryopsis sp. KO-2023]